MLLMFLKTRDPVKGFSQGFCLNGAYFCQHRQMHAYLAKVMHSYSKCYAEVLLQHLRADICERQGGVHCQHKALHSVHCMFVCI